MAKTTGKNRTAKKLSVPGAGAGRGGAKQAGKRGGAKQAPIRQDGANLAKRAGKEDARAKLPKPYPQTYRFLEHTADIMIEATGPDFAAALLQAAEAMFHVMGHAEPKTGFLVDVHASNDEELVVYFLSQILAESEARELVPARIDILQHETAIPHIKAKVWGEKKRPRDAIKAVTFHELKVENDLIQGCRIQVLLDV